MILFIAGAINSLQALRTARSAGEYLLPLCLMGIWLPLFAQIALYGEMPGMVLTKAVQLGYISVVVGAGVIVARHLLGRRQK